MEEKYRYDIQRLLDSQPERWYTICTCRTAAAAIAVLSALVTYSRDPQVTYSVQIILEGG